MKRSTVPDFAIGGLAFQCWITSDGVNELGLAAERYEWRSSDDRCVVGRNTGNAMCWAMVDGRMIGSHFQSLDQAMAATARALQRKAA